MVTRNVIRRLYRTTSIVSMALSPLLLASRAEAQDDPVIDRLIEEGFDEEVGDEERAERLEEMARRPLDLRRASAADLALIPGISPQSAQGIVAYLRLYELRSVDDLAAIPGFDTTLLPILRRLTTIGAESSLPITIASRTRAAHDLQRRRGYRDGVTRRVVRRDPASGDSLGVDTLPLGPSYRGSPLAFATRLLIERGSIGGGVLIEKDPGELLFYRDTLAFPTVSNGLVDPSGSDISSTARGGLGAFVSWHAYARSDLGTLLLGDFTTAYGQGLIYGDPFGGRKGMEPTRDPYNSGRGLRPYRSSGERYYFKGIGARIEPRGAPLGLHGDVWYSRRRLDGSVAITIGPNGEVSGTLGAIGEDGYLRTRSDLRTDDRIVERLVTGHLGGTIGTTSLAITATNGERSFTFDTGDHAAIPLESWSMGSISVDGEIGGTCLFGEIAALLDGGVAANLGVAGRLDRLDLTLSGRSYGSRFLTPYGIAFGESPSTARNEQGLYLGGRGRLARGLFLSFFGDIHHAPSATATTPFARSGIDGMIALDYAHGPSGVTVAARVTAEREGIAITATDELGRAYRTRGERNGLGGRVTIGWRPKGSPLDVGVRIERRGRRESSDSLTRVGDLLHLDLRWRPFERLRISGRLLLFAADDGILLYAFERDHPGRIGSATLSGEGGRRYLLIEWMPSDRVAISAKYGETWYADRTRIAEGGGEEIDGPTTGRMSLQVDYRIE